MSTNFNERDGYLLPPLGAAPIPPMDWGRFRTALLLDQNLNNAIATLREIGLHALSDAIVPAAMAGDLDQLTFAWNAAVDALAGTEWEPPDYTQWQKLADDCGIPIVFAEDGKMAKK